VCVCSLSHPACKARAPYYTGKPLYAGCPALPYFSTLSHKRWVGYLSRYSGWLRAGRSGDRIPVGARFSAPLQTGPGAHPASCTMGTGSFPGVESGRGVTLTPHPLLVPWPVKRVEPTYLVNGMTSEKKLVNIKCVLILSTTFV
jgi:hypothetical protein